MGSVLRNAVDKLIA